MESLSFFQPFFLLLDCHPVNLFIVGSILNMYIMVFTCPLSRFFLFLLDVHSLPANPQKASPTLFSLFGDAYRSSIMYFAPQDRFLLF